MGETTDDEGRGRGMSEHASPKQPYWNPLIARTVGDLPRRHLAMEGMTAYVLEVQEFFTFRNGRWAEDR